MQMKLDHDSFCRVVRDTPLIAIDLIVQGPDERVLLGMRKNPPAQDHWFVPGGRILKNETLDEAFTRITRSELGIAVPRHEATTLGVHEHLYSDNFAGDSNFGTHYVVLAYRLEINPTSESLPRDQHRAYDWFRIADLLRHGNVHPNTKAYFESSTSPQPPDPSNLATTSAT
jgi:colanic acid biosynthesis protein WcaH